MSKRPRIFALLLSVLLVLAACGDGGGTATTGGADHRHHGGRVCDDRCSGGRARRGNSSLPTATRTGQPQVECGANIIKEMTESADVGLTIEIFGDSQLGGDADRDRVGHLG